MFIYLPYETFNESIVALSDYHLARQLIDATHVYDCCNNNKSFHHHRAIHPTVRMWKPYQRALVVYIRLLIYHYTKRYVAAFKTAPLSSARNGHCRIRSPLLLSKLTTNWKSLRELLGLDKWSRFCGGATTTKNSICGDIDEIMSMCVADEEEESAIGPEDKPMCVGDPCFHESYQALLCVDERKRGIPQANSSYANFQTAQCHIEDYYGLY